MSAVLRRNMFPLPTLSGRVVEMPILKNPGKYAVKDLFASAPHGDVRLLRDGAGDIYAWPANEAMHVDVASAFDLPFKNRADLQANSFLWNINNIPPEYGSAAELMAHMLSKA